MTLSIYWQIDSAALPVRAEPSQRLGWAASINDPRNKTANRARHYGQIARAAALTAFDGLFIAYRPDSDDSQIVAASLARHVTTLALIPEFPASVGSAVYAAKEAVSFQRATHDRLGWAILPPRSAEDRRIDGDAVADEDQQARLDEFLTVARGVHGQKGFTFKGQHFEVLNGGFDEPLDRAAFPTVFLQGDDDDAIAFSAKHADVHIFSDAPLTNLGERIKALDSAALAQGRTVRFGLKLSVAARETTEKARRDTVGAIDIVGDYDAVADALADRVAIGIDHLILSAEPSLEEAYRLGEFVLPRLRARIGQLRAAA